MRKSTERGWRDTQAKGQIWALFSLSANRPKPLVNEFFDDFIRDGHSIFAAALNCIENHRAPLAAVISPALN